jgi:hypothetical protein
MTLKPSFAGWSTATTFAQRRIIFFQNWSWFRFSIARFFGGIFILKPWLITVESLKEDSSGGLIFGGKCSVESGQSSSDVLTLIQTSFSTGVL